MKLVTTTLLFLWTAVVVSMQVQAEGDQIIGVWTNLQGSTKIEFSKANDRYYAKIVWLENPFDSSGNPRLDLLNPDLEKRRNPLIGTTVINNLRYSEKSWIEGKLYIPKRGKYANCSAVIIKDTLYITGSMGFFADTKTWLKK